MAVANVLRRVDAWRRVGSAPACRRRWSGTGAAAWTAELLEDRLLLAATPVLVRDIAPGRLSSFPNRLTEAGGTLFFTADDGASGTELWATRGGAATTVRLADITAGAGGTDLRDFTAVGNRLFFTVPGNFATGTTLWVSDGTPGGTRSVTALPTVFGSGFTPALSGSNLIAAGNSVFFKVGANDLWKSDGTAAGTVPVATGIDTPSATITNLTAVGSTVYFTSTDGSNSVGLWKSNGTAAGTLRVNAVAPGLGSNPDNLTVVGNTVYFTDFPGGGTARNLWKSDGTAAGTVLVLQGTGFGAAELTAAGNRLYFVQTGGARTLWVSDGTTAGTMLVAPAPIRTSGGLFGPPRLTAVGARLYAVIDDLAFGQELFTVVETVNRPPVAEAGGPYVVGLPDTVTLDASRSTDPDRGDAIVRYEWDLDGDGTFETTSTVPTLALTPALRTRFGLSVGVHTLRLRVTDRGGLTATDTAVLTVNVLPAARLSVVDAEVAEGEAGPRNFLSFFVRLNRTLNVPVRFQWRTGGGTATAGVDYIGTQNTVVIPAGQRQALVRVAVIGDQIGERDETLRLAIYGLQAAGGVATFGRRVATGTIRDDDGATLSIADARAAEGPAGQVRRLVFTVSLDRTLDADLTARFVTGGGTATAGTDYGVARGVLRIAAGRLTGQLVVTIRGDAVVEPNETLAVRVFAARAGGQGVTVSHGIGIGTILNDDRPTSRTDGLFAAGLADSLLG